MSQNKTLQECADEFITFQNWTSEFFEHAVVAGIPGAVGLKIGSFWMVFISAVLFMMLVFSTGFRLILRFANHTEFGRSAAQMHVKNNSMQWAIVTLVICLPLTGAFHGALWMFTQLVTKGS